MGEDHLEGLTVIERRLVIDYATTIIGGIRYLADVKPAKLIPIVEIEIRKRLYPDAYR